MSHPFAHLREHFPILARRTYLANHSMGAVPRAALDALSEYYDTWSTGGIHAWDGPWWERVEGFNAEIEGLLGAPPGTVVPLQNATRGMAAVASALEVTPERPRIVMTDLEFTTSYPFWRGLESAGAELVLVRSEDGITVPVERLVEALDERTLLVPTCHVYFRSGAVQDLATLTKAAHEVGALVLGDGYQAAGTVPFDVSALGVDFYVGGSHKWLCGGPGAGFLYVREDLVGDLRPRLTGWFGLKDPFAYAPDTGPGEPAPGARRFLAGTPNIPALYAARAGLEMITEVGVSAIKAWQDTLGRRVIEEATDRGFALGSPEEPSRRSGMVCLRRNDAEALTSRLEAEGISVDFRPDCGMRVAPHFYNDESDVDRLFEAIDRLS